MNADVVVDNEFQTRQTDTGIGQLAKIKGQLGIADVHHDLDTNVRHLAPLYLRDLGLEQAVVNEAGVALGAAGRDQHAILEHLTGIATTDHGGDTQLAGDDGGMVGTSPTVGHNGRGTLHDWLPIRIGHVSHQHVAGLHFVHVGNVVDHPNRTSTDFLSDGPPLHNDRALALELVTILRLAGRLALDRFGTGLQDIKFAINAVLAPLDVHRAAVVLLNHQRLRGQLLHVAIT